ncbi:hypothetical protein [Aquirufa novilacunae]|uniref:Uncharacterized protein n=1 Tax=Aquirufa novilacunae TaxID=3139305 RepID=A0ABW8U7D6_9BACT
MINIAFASSFSSQVGLLAFLKANDSMINYLIIIPSNEHKNNEYTCTIFQKNDKIKNIVVVKSLYIKLLIICCVDFIKVLSKLNLIKISIISPRPFWLFSILGPVSFANYFSDIFARLDNKNCYNFYYGDGLSCFCYESKPFWLKIGNNSLTPSRIENKYSQYFYYYHMFESDIIFNKTCLENDINVLQLDYNNLNASIDSALNLINSKFSFSDCLAPGVSEVLLSNRKLLIFTTTTFSKTNRCSFDDEMKLYIRYFTENIPEDNSFLLFKFHPSAGEKMNNMLFNILLNKYGKRVLFVNSFISAIPIEIILKFLIKYHIFLESNITLFACSSGTAMPKSLFTNINLVISFGRSFLHNILNENYLEKRLHQEEILKYKFFV